MFISTSSGCLVLFGVVMSGQHQRRAKVASVRPGEMRSHEDKRAFISMAARVPTAALELIAMVETIGALRCSVPRVLRRTCSRTATV
jgi:hypothetical protein